MRILIVSRSTPFHRLGGMEVVAWDLAKEFANLGHSVTVLTTACDALGRRTVIDDVSLHCVDAPSGRYSLKWWINARRAFNSDYHDQVDVVLSVSAGAFSISRKKSPAVFVAQLHGTAWGEFLSKIKQFRPWPWLTSLRNLAWIVRDLRYRSFDALTFVGPAVLEDAQRLPMSAVLGKSIKKSVILNGINEAEFRFSEEARQRLRRQYGFSLDDKVVVWSSRLHAQKGVIEGVSGFLAAFEQQKNLRMLILGDGPELPYLEKIIEDRSASGVIKIVGRVPRKELGEYLSAGDAFIFTTRRVEGLPMNVLEALANGLPTIVSDSINNPDFNSRGVNPMSVSDVSRGILDLPLGGSRASKLKEQFTLRYSAEEYIDLFFNVKNRGE